MAVRKYVASGILLFCFVVGMSCAADTMEVGIENDSESIKELQEILAKQDKRLNALYEELYGDYNGRVIEDMQSRKYLEKTDIFYRDLGGGFYLRSLFLVVPQKQYRNRIKNHFHR